MELTFHIRETGPWKYIQVMWSGSKHQEWKNSAVRSERVTSRGDMWNRVNGARLGSERVQAAGAESPASLSGNFLGSSKNSKEDREWSWENKRECVGDKIRLQKNQADSQPQKKL